MIQSLGEAVQKIRVMRFKWTEANLCVKAGEARTHTHVPCKYTRVCTQSQDRRAVCIEADTNTYIGLQRRHLLLTQPRRLLRRSS